MRGTIAWRTCYPKMCILLYQTILLGGSQRAKKSSYVSVFLKLLKYIQITGKPEIRDYGIIKMAGQAHLLRNPSAGELKLSASQKNT